MVPDAILQSTGACCGTMKQMCGGLATGFAGAADACRARDAAKYMYMFALLLYMCTLLEQSKAQTTYTAAQLRLDMDPWIHSYI